MTTRYLTQRPQAIQAVEWTGSNLAEVQAFGSNWGFTVTDNGDGTITTAGMCCTGQDLTAGTWLVSDRAMAVTADQVNEFYQELPSTGAPFEYTVTAATTPPA